MDAKSLREISLEPYREDMIKLRKVLKPYLEEKFTNLKKYAKNGKTSKQIYSVDTSFHCFPSLCCFYAGKLNLESYSSIKYHFPSLTPYCTYLIVKIIIEEINEENNYNFRIKSQCLGGTFWFRVYW